ncbi:hypothetical protein BOTBODRAFT_254196 [Botryobasidium botryosum FD-172 SS1]|uniref:Uncharacterized protein n=1 Tax=Botryobasidium botryosum (strain FD-172 SS1) TaxID=930990 RepID=A0A067LTM9_BOTB1|nr:hypothetical protein BOTBODRAFT_254196 [Botryobasidium botryosum FD-172 SS1]
MHLAFNKAITPMISSHFHSMSPPLQILSVGSAVIVAAKAFWVQPGDTGKPQITDSSNQYMEFNTAEHVRAALLEAFQDAGGLYATSESRAALLEVVLSNQLSHAS